MSTAQSSHESSVFVGGLALSSVWQDVHDYLGSFGPVANLYLPRCKSTGMILGYAKATFASADSVGRLLSNPHHFIDGRCVGVSLWKKKAEYVPLKDEVRLRKVHVRFRSGLPERRLQDYFSTFGVVEHVDIRRDPLTQAHRKFCYVLFRSPESAQEVARIRKHSWLGTHMICQMSKPTNSKTTAVAPSQQPTRGSEAALPPTTKTNLISSFEKRPKLKAQTRSLKRLSIQQGQEFHESSEALTSLNELGIEEARETFSKKLALSPSKLTEMQNSLPIIVEENNRNQILFPTSFPKPTSKSYHKFFESSKLSPEIADRGNLLFRVRDSRGFLNPL